MYKILFSQDAEKQFKKLDKELQRRVHNILKRIIIRPQSYAKRIVGVPYYKLRAGDYRIILDIKESEKVLFIIKIGHRSDIYKRL